MPQTRKEFLKTALGAVAGIALAGVAHAAPPKGFTPFREVVQRPDMYHIVKTRLATLKKKGVLTDYTLSMMSSGVSKYTFGSRSVREFITDGREMRIEYKTPQSEGKVIVRWDKNNSLREILMTKPGFNRLWERGDLDPVKGHAYV